MTELSNHTTNTQSSLPLLLHTILYIQTHTNISHSLPTYNRALLITRMTLSIHICYGINCLSLSPCKYPSRLHPYDPPCPLPLFRHKTVSHSIHPFLLLFNHLSLYSTISPSTQSALHQQIQRLQRIRLAPKRFNKMETNLPNNNNYEIKVKHTNSKYCRFCIRHEIPKLIQDNYLPGKVLEKINTHSYSGFVHYAQNYIISEYESICCIQNCYICND